MSCGYFVYLILLIILQWTHCSLLSRFRYPNEYTAPPESMVLPEDLPDDIYESLIDERPELEPILAPLRSTKLRRPQTSYTRKTTTTVPSGEPSVYHEYEFPRVHRRKEVDDEDEVENEAMRGIKQYTNQPERVGNHTTDSSAVARSSRMPYASLIMRNNNNQTNNDTRKYYYGYGYPPWRSAPYKATCYTCGVSAGDMPKNSICHDLFDSEDWRVRTLKRFFRSRCVYHWTWRASMRQSYSWYGYWYEHDPGLKTVRMAAHIPGCYKRFLDIGTVYTARGCRRWWPDGSGGLAGNRFIRLEHLLRHFKDRCISSPHASLTPFSRGISLFARYHVCVCPDKYCNSATVSKAYVFLLFLSLILIGFLM